MYFTEDLYSYIFTFLNIEEYSHIRQTCSFYKKIWDHDILLNTRSLTINDRVIFYSNFFGNNKPLQPVLIKRGSIEIALMDKNYLYRIFPHPKDTSYKNILECLKNIHTYFRKRISN